MQELQHISQTANLSPIIRRVCYVFVPTLLRSSTAEKSRVSRTKQSNSATTWLNGLRGFAAFCVFNFHFMFVYNHGTMTNLGWRFDDNHKWLIELPFIRLLYSGTQMVNIFFLVSGYVIALQPLKLAARNDSLSRDKLLQSLSSSIFRRFFRLYLPVFCSTLLVVLCVRLYFFEPLRSFHKADLIFHENHISRLDTTWAQLSLWAQEQWDIVNLFAWGKRFTGHHDSHLWTIALELQSSFLLYVVLAALCRVRERPLLAALLLVSLYCLAYSRWEATLYLWGAALAQMDVMRHKTRIPTLDGMNLLTRNNDYLEGDTEFRCEKAGPPQADQFSISTTLTNAMLSLGIVFSLYLLSSPWRKAESTPGYIFLSSFVPEWFQDRESLLPRYGAALLVFCLLRLDPSSPLLKALNSPPCQYMAHISFAFYIVHGPILHMIGYVIPFGVWSIIGGSETTLQYTFGLSIGWSISLCIALWAADVFNREIEQRCVAVTKHLEESIFRKEE